mmetsp:Transcript_18281/g.46772  ORF Transcript_18281/g.46772 Transcript_18281/m.46772 type:complete len:203 (-) Transcript_18281:23-631(-)
MVSSMMAFTMSPSFFFSAAIAFARVTPDWDITSSMSFASTPEASTSSPSSISSMADEVSLIGFIEDIMGACGALNCSAACDWAWAERSSILASPKIMYVSEAGDLKTSGFWMTKRMFFDFLTVTRMMPGTGFMPSFSMALRDFFSLRLCFPRDPSPSPSPPASPSTSSKSGTSSSSSSSSLSSSSTSSISASSFLDMLPCEN